EYRSVRPLKLLAHFHMQYAVYLFTERDRSIAAGNIDVAVPRKASPCPLEIERRKCLRAPQFQPLLGWPLHPPSIRSRVQVQWFLETLERMSASFVEAKT